MGRCARVYGSFWEETSSGHCLYCYKHLQISLNDDLRFGQVADPANGIDGKDGTVTVVGKDGQHGVSLNGKDGSIGLTGPSGPAGEVITTNIKVVNGSPGLDGKDGVVRIQYGPEPTAQQPNPPVMEVATLDDGLNFVGDDGKTVARTLNQTLAITGASTITRSSVDGQSNDTHTVKAADGYTIGNIQVVQAQDAQGAPITGALSVQLSEHLNLGANGSVQVGDLQFDDEGVRFTQVGSDDQGNPVTMTVGPVISRTGIDAGQTTITNLKPGALTAGGTEAATTGQVYEVQQSVNDLAQGVNQVVGQLHTVERRLGQEIKRVERDGHAGTAAAMATAGLPQAYAPGRSMFAVAGGVWRGESGYALGLSTVSDSGKWVLKGTANTSSRGGGGATVGVGYQW